MIIGVGGFGFSGSGAVIDYLEEIDGLRVMDAFEMKLANSYDGLLDLEYHLCQQRVRYLSGDHAIRRFMNLANEMAGKIWDKDRRQEFQELTNRYLDSLIQVKWRGSMQAAYGNHVLPPDPRERQLVYSTRKKLSELLYTRTTAPRSKPLRRYYFRARRKLSRILNPNARYKWFDMYLSVAPDGFLEKTRDYVRQTVELLAPAGSGDIVLDQPFPFNDPAAVFRYFDDPKAIIVWRDPRDQYLLFKRLIGNSAFVPVDDVADYVKYMKILIRETQQAQYNRDQVLNIQFEDLIYEYDKTTRRIDDFIGVAHTQHAKRIFDPSVSCANTRLFERYPEDAEAIAYIAENMKEFLYPYENYPVRTSNAKPFL